MMPWWLYKGRVTTPVNIPGKGPVVLEPRMVFESPVASVAHLKRIGHVVEARPPKEAVKPKPEPEPESVPAPVEVKKPESDGAPAKVSVVASVPSKPVEPEEVKPDTDPVSDEAGEGDALAESEEKQEQEGPNSKRRRGKRGR